MDIPSPRPGDALLLVDVQLDFMPGGSLPIPSGDQVIGPLNAAIALFRSQGLAVFATRDWHPRDHCSFKAHGGVLPAHCIAGSRGAAFPAELALPPDAVIVSKGIQADADAYSGFEGTGLAGMLRAAGVTRLFVGGLATDYCVLNTVTDALQEGFAVVLLPGAMRGLNLQAGDDEAAIATMIERGAAPGSLPPPAKARQRHAQPRYR
ncbi:isochorismatase family protein [Massilia sp. GCM10020059]|uniref:nicotinamidase n=1 Tax=Massilia agrisoli TaxID=2892444 RepID=A0ABS8IWF4_9BURK|nr:isochorismatase family protein [Massilia agrisoli]MCC6072013.1 isochorismatase family protein [Massilia agrisoli]